MVDRPKNLNLLSIHFPLTAIISILHRLSGIGLFLLIPVLLWLLALSLTAKGFAAIHDYFTTSYGKGLQWIIVALFTYHFIAGIKHLLADIGYGTSLRGGRIASLFTLMIWLVVLLGYYQWQNQS